MKSNSSPLFALTSIDKTNELDNGSYIVLDKNRNEYGQKQFYKNYGWDFDYIEEYKYITHYLRPLRDGTEVVRNGYTQIKNEDFFFLEEVVRWARGVGRNQAPEFIQQFIQTKLAQMGK